MNEADAPSSTSSTGSSGSSAAPRLPAWAAELSSLYESDAASQFVLHGNVHDRVLLPLSDGPALGGIVDFLLRALMPRFDVILTYDLGNGIRLEKGGEIFAQWPSGGKGTLPKQPRPAVETLTHYLRYVANLHALGQKRLQVGIVVRDASLVCPRTHGATSHDQAATALLLRDWSSDSAFADMPLATFLLAENLNDLHPIVAANGRAATLEVPLPAASELADGLGLLAPGFPRALVKYADGLDDLAAQLVGASLGAVESLLHMHEHRGESLDDGDLAELKKALVEKDTGGLIEFVESTRTLDDFRGQDHVRDWLRDDIALWRQGELGALPMGYLLCGPVGTGKTFLVKCLAGEAGVPVVRIRNFRDKWIGSTEGNLETIFRLLHALGRCFVFVDEADQALGRRGQSSGDSGLSGRIYSMIAQEMSNPENRGRIVWVLASSRPDLIEVDLKRPGRVDVRIPLFPTTDPATAADLLSALCRRQHVDVSAADLEPLHAVLPDLLTPGAAEALAVKTYRAMRTRGLAPIDALRECLDGYQSPVPEAVLEAQIRLALAEASDLDLVPKAIRERFA